MKNEIHYERGFRKFMFWLTPLMLAVQTIAILILFNDEKYEEFINIKISKEKLNEVEGRYLSNDLNFVNSELEFKFLYSMINNKQESG